jgi:hypothetical protein
MIASAAATANVVQTSERVDRRQRESRASLFREGIARSSRRGRSLGLLRDCESAD